MNRRADQEMRPEDETYSRTMARVTVVVKEGRYGTTVLKYRTWSDNESRKCRVLKISSHVNVSESFDSIRHVPLFSPSSRSHLGAP